MTKFFLLIGVILPAFISAATAAGPVSKSWFTVEQNDPESEVVLRVSIPEPEVSVITVGHGQRTVISLPDCGQLLEEGEPALPFVSAFVQISAGRDVILEAEPLTSTVRQLAAPVLPAGGPDADLADCAQLMTAIDSETYASHDLLPAAWVEIREPEIWRDLRIVQIAFFPVRYRPAANEIEVVRDIRIRLRAGDASELNVLRQQGPVTGTWAQLYEAIVINFDWQEETRDGLRENYYVLTPDAFVLEFSDFIAWKNTQGFNAHIVPFSQIAPQLTDQNLKAWLLAAYQNMETRPTFVVLTGDAGIAPIHIFNSPSEGQLVDDTYFSLMDGLDYLPDFHMSRLPVQNTTHLRTMLAKWRYFERTPNMSVPSYYRTGVMSCSGLYPSQQRTKEQTQYKLEHYLGFETFHTMYRWNAQAHSQMIAWLSEGASILNYRGEGWYTGWSPAHAYSFDTSHVAQIQNINKLTIVTSIGCGVGQFAQSYDGFGEAWMKLGNDDQLRGAVAFVGPTYNTHTTFNNWLDRGIYGGFAWYKISRIGPAMNYGKMFMRDHFWGSSVEWMCESMVREYLLFGIPDTYYRTRLPETLSVKTGFSRNSTDVSVRVRYPFGDPVRYAQFKLAWDGVVKTGYTDRDGILEISVPPDLPYDRIDFVVTSLDSIPGTGQVYFPNETGNLLITEIKPDILATGTAGDLVEIYNQGPVPVNLRGWSLGDLDLCDPAFVDTDVNLGPSQFAVVEFAGTSAIPAVIPASYGYDIRANFTADFSSQENVVVLRDPRGRVVDCLAYHDGSGEASRNVAGDLSRLTGDTSPLLREEGGYWAGPDWIHRDDYERVAIDWRVFAGNGGPGSISRLYDPFAQRWVQTAGEHGDSPDNFAVTDLSGFGGYGPHVTPTPAFSPTESPVPTATPEGTPDETAVPSRTPTRTPTSDPSASPTATPTPTVTPPPTPSGELELLLRVNQREYLPGDMFQLTSVFRNPGTAVMSQHYIVLDVEEQYWFWPSWSEEVDSRPWTIPGPGNWSYTYLDFIWPAGAGSANGIRFWGALLSPTSSELLCGLAMCEFGFSE